MMSELLIGEEVKREAPDSNLQAVQQVLKRRRLRRKQPLAETADQDHVGVTWESVFQKYNAVVPRVGRKYFGLHDEIVAEIQPLIPQFQIKHVVMCRGTNRLQPPSNTQSAEDIPLRLTVVVSREDGQVQMDGGVEEWTKIPRYKRMRKVVPAKVSLTAYGIASLPPVTDNSLQRRDPLIPEDRRQNSPDVPRELETGYPPKAIPRHGPGFIALDPEGRREIARLHNNLGHPDANVFVKFLTERKAEPQMIQAARDYCCDTCLEIVPEPKLARPSAIHQDGDFGDTIGMDVAYWTNSAGEKFMFTHVIDEATLFHQAVATGRTAEDQFAVLADSWFKWAGPCKVLYVDPAGEYVGDHFREQLQKEGIQAQVSAGEAHWQLGRVEAHGKILKGMLSRMDHEQPITEAGEFRRCLRAAIQAKNSLSRVKGFTPEQAVLGKMARLPASLVSDDQASTHTLANSPLPEGVAFRHDLQRREQARVAFIQADNDNSFRRALLRRSRPPCQRFDAGDWVLYWRRQKAGSSTRGERGRWYGPAQVICHEAKVVWLSHCGQLIRAAPEQLRSASMREWRLATQSRTGEGTSERDSARVRRVVDIAGDGDLPTREQVEVQGEAPLGYPSEAVPSPNPAMPVQAHRPEETTPDEDVAMQPASVQAEAGADQPEMEVSPVASVDLEHAQADEHMNVPLPDEDDDDILFGDTEDFFQHPGLNQVWEVNVHETEVPVDSLPSPNQALHFVMLATTERKKRVEVRLRDLSQQEREQFVGAKGKEVRAWLDHGTVKKVVGGTLSDQQLMRCRWVLTWKAPETEGGPRRAKARLVVLGFEDPDLSDIPNDAPTLGKDGRQLLLQMVASRGWTLINFDVSTAFLQGKGDGRKLGIHPPEELRTALGMRHGDQCQLEGGAYGRIDAPFLWFQTFKETLERLGFIQSPFDACTFCLISPGEHGETVVHGVLGVHVDDGIGGGDELYTQAIQRLRDTYSFGSYDEGDFTFTGIRFRQWDDGSIEMDQTRYLEKIEPITVARSRRTDPSASLEPDEIRELRRLNGSLQYAAVHTRPDIAAKVGYLQTRVTKGEVRHLIEANRVLHEAKTHPVSLMIVPIAEEHVTFCTFSDASFATSKDSKSYQGTFVVATDWRMLQNEKAVVVPMAWTSKKISRVVRSTLSAEVVSLCASVDRMSWIRLFWEWMRNPGIDIANPEDVLSRAPRASLVTDCKSAYDVATKTAVPTCSELRTQLECLLLRERLQENCQLRWVHSKAMLADCLTKVMDSSTLRRIIREGRYTLVDEDHVLQTRAGNRQSLMWLKGKDQSASESKIS